MVISLCSVRLWLAMFFITLLISCDSQDPANPFPSGSGKPLTARIAKWYNDHRAAISLTYDHGWNVERQGEQDVVFALCKQHNIAMDIDAVTADWTPEKVAFVKKELIPQGLRFFGHGHWHVNHDALSYDSALASFTQCYRTMALLGLQPVAYAYPGGYGHAQSTRNALADAGFLSGRLHTSSSHTNPWIMPDTVREPDDWYGIPSLIMQRYEYANATTTIHNTAELIPFLDEALQRSAWLVTTYHEISDQLPQGAYQVQDFEGDIAAIAARDFWAGSFSAVTLYARERLHATVALTAIVDPNGDTTAVKLLMSDGLPNERFNQELTVIMTLPSSWLGKQVIASQPGIVPQQGKVTADSVMLHLLPNERQWKVSCKE